MTIQVSNRTIAEMTATISELDKLTSQPGNLTPKQSQRHSFLLAKLALLRQGVAPSELRSYEENRLLREAGLLQRPRAPRTRLEEDIEKEWRDFCTGEEVPQTRIPPTWETRANEAGQQSIAYTQLAAGGAFVPQGFYDRTLETMKQYDEVFDDFASNIVETDTGSNFPAPIWDDVANQSVIVGESVQSTEVDIANFGDVQLGAYSFRSKLVGVSIELLQDSAFPIGSILERIFAMRHARGVGQALIRGTAVGQPTGLLTAGISAGATVVVAAGSSANTGGSETGATSIGTQDINKIFHALNPAYRDPTAVWAMNDSTLQYLDGLLDKNGRPIVHYSGLENDAAGAWPCLYRRRVAICPSMPNIASGQNSVVFYNPAYFIQRRVPSASYVRRYSQVPGIVEKGLVAFEGWMRCDSNLVAPNSSYVPAAILQNHS